MKPWIGGTDEALEGDLHYTYPLHKEKEAAFRSFELLWLNLISMPRAIIVSMASQ